MKKRILGIGVALLLGTLLPRTTRADFAFSGDPSADGWNLIGNSGTLGIYARGSANFNYNLFKLSYQISAANPLITSFAGTGWAAGDTVLGVGGVIVDQTNPNLGANARVLVKYGTSTATWSASTTTTIPGDGVVSFSGGFGGTGSIQLATNSGSLTAGGAGTARLLDTSNRYDGAASVVAALDLGRLNYTFLDGKLKSWQILLNTSLLQRLGLAPPGPAVGDKFVANLQQGGSNSTETTDFIPAVSALAIPEPSSFILLGMGAGAMFIVARRRKS